MTEATERIRKQISDLPPDDREELVAALVSDMATTDADTIAEWVKESDRRMSLYRQGQMSGLTLDEMIASRAK